MVWRRVSSGSWESCSALTTTPLIPVSLVQRALRGETSEMPAFAEARSQFERDYLTQLLQITRGNVTQAAAYLKVPRHILAYRMAKYGIGRKGWRHKDQGRVRALVFHGLLLADIE